MLHHYAGIYAIICKANNKYYVGSSKDIQNRWWSHLYCLRKSKNSCKLLQNAWNKYGEEAFVLQVLEKVDDIDKLIEVEQRYLDFLQPEYNLRKIAERNTGIHWDPEMVERVAAQNRGRKMSPEFSANLSRKLKGRVFSDQTIQRMKDAKATTPDITRQRMSQAKKGIVPTIATEAAAKANKGKSRPQSVIDKISETRRLTAQRQKAEGYTRKRDEKGKFIGGG